MIHLAYFSYVYVCCYVMQINYYCYCQCNRSCYAAAQLRPYHRYPVMRGTPS